MESFYILTITNRMEHGIIWLVIAIHLLSFCGVVWAANYKKGDAVICCFLTIYIGTAYGLLLACYW